MKKFGLFVKFGVKEGERDILIEILLEAAEKMIKIPDCEIYIVNHSSEDPTAVFVYEVWANEEAHHASLTLESTQTLIKRARPIITGMERISTFVPVGGKGL